MAAIVKHYNHFIHNLSDPRVQTWPLMSSPMFPISIIAVYLTLIYKILPNYMENRKPFDLKKILIWYNIIQIVSCCVIIYGVLTSGWTTHYSLGCQPVDYSTNSMAMRMLNFVWWTWMLKAVELLETAFFILRKKYNQVSKLHVYHHTSTFFLGWFGVKFVGGGMATFPIIINSFIHVLMYTYYLFALFGPKMQQRISKWKPRLTILQMIQFVILVAHASQALKSDCHVPKQALLIWVPNVALIFAMFYDFYTKNYRMKRKSA